MVFKLIYLTFRHDYLPEGEAGLSVYHANPDCGGDNSADNHHCKDLTTFPQTRVGTNPNDSTPRTPVKSSTISNKLTDTLKSAPRRVV